MLQTCTPLQNHLLAGLPAAARYRLLPRLIRVSLSPGQILYNPGDTLRNLIFPIDAVISLMYLLKNGTSTATAMIGNEGVVGAALILSGQNSIDQAIVQCPGDAYFLPTQTLKEELYHHNELKYILLRYIQVMITQTSLTATCNRHHTICQQVCRFLLMSLDRGSDNHLDMTQELIANMLGVRREGVTEAASKLQAQGVIKYRRGQITVLDRHKLEQLSCECYQIDKQESDRLLRHSYHHTSDKLAAHG